MSQATTPRQAAGGFDGGSARRRGEWRLVLLPLSRPAPAQLQRGGRQDGVVRLALPPSSSSSPPSHRVAGATVTEREGGGGERGEGTHAAAEFAPPADAAVTGGAPGSSTGPATTGFSTTANVVGGDDSTKPIRFAKEQHLVATLVAAPSTFAEKVRSIGRPTSVWRCFSGGTLTPTTTVTTMDASSDNAGAIVFPVANPLALRCMPA